MTIRLLTYCLCWYLMVCMGCSQTGVLAPKEQSNMDKEKAIGYWQLPRSQQNIAGVSTFYYDGDYLTLFLFTEKEWMWRSDDDYYRLHTIWQGDTLCYMPPFGGRWAHLARFDGADFYIFNDSEGLRWEYIRIEPHQIQETERAILRPRNVHDYTIKPTDKH